MVVAAEVEADVVEVEVEEVVRNINLNNISDFHIELISVVLASTTCDRAVRVVLMLLVNVHAGNAIDNRH